MSDARKVEPVAEIESWVNGSYHRNYKIKWLKDVEQGTKLYTEPVRNPTTDHTFIRAYEVGAHVYTTTQEANKAIYRGEGDRWYPLYRANREVEADTPTAPTIDTQLVASVTIDHYRGVKGMENVTFEYFGDLPDGTYSLHTAPVVLDPDPCGACGGSGWVVRDPDIGTDQECGSCDGEGFDKLDIQPVVTDTQKIAKLQSLLVRAKQYVDMDTELNAEIARELKK